jgi:gluconolactonase
MKIPKKLAFAFTLLLGVWPVMSQPNNPPAAPALPETVAPGAVLKLVTNGFSWAEGPSCDKDGNVFFTDQNNNRIMKWSAADGLVTEWLKPSGRANGMNFDAKGNLLACCDEKTELWSIAPDGTHTVLCHEFDGKPLDGPNDVWVMPNGGMYLTDPFYARNWWNYRQRPQDSEEVYYLAPDHKELKRVTTDLTKPNGIVGTPDGKILFVSDIQRRQTWAYDPQADGTLANKRLICADGSDGMTIDELGNLYLTGNGNSVRVWDKDGKSLGRIPVPQTTANICFGGKDKKTLFITATSGLYAIEMKVKGGNQSK